MSTCGIYSRHRGREINIIIDMCSHRNVFQTVQFDYQSMMAHSGMYNVHASISQVKQ